MIINKLIGYSDVATTTYNSSSNEQRNFDHQRSRTTTYTSVYNDQSIIKQRHDRPRLKLADFNMLRTLGTGSFGRVHLVQSRVNARYYAVKVLKKFEVVRLKQVEHTNNEKHILESVAHPFLVNMWGTFQDNVNLYMVMDYVPGGELFSVLRRSKVSAFFFLLYCLRLNFLFSVFPTTLQSFMLLKLFWLLNICTQKMSFTVI